jgi:hypothetical protein
LVVDNHEDELSSMSLLERVRLFNEHIKNQQTEEEPKVLQAPPTRRRNTRYKTQPVTNHEVETAQRISPLAASFVRPPDDQLLGE